MKILYYLVIIALIFTNGYMLLNKVHTVHVAIEENVIIEAETVHLQEEFFELPLRGSTCYSTHNIAVYTDMSQSKVAFTLSAGQGATIIDEIQDYWLIKRGDLQGYVSHKTMMINLPDIIPSIVYDNYNLYASALKSSMKAIPSITGEALYSGHVYNERLNKNSDITPILYESAKKIQVAQRLALKEGNTLVIREAYRPYSVQDRIVQALEAFSLNDVTVREGITELPWSIGWFVYRGVSNHQVGYAVDLEIAKVTEMSKDLQVTMVKNYVLYEHHTPFHELSYRSALLKSPVPSKDRMAWLAIEQSEQLTEGSQLLLKYMTAAGFTPLASEWWHYNDLDALALVEKLDLKGEYTVNEIWSRKVED